jgi:hypothetical protein
MKHRSAVPPTVVIAGAQKAGTTSLATYLAQREPFVTHPAIEFPYFLSTRWRSYDAAFRHHFPDTIGQSDSVILKSAGIMFLPEAAERLHDQFPDVRIVCLLRDPVARARSAHGFLRSRGLEPLASFEAALDAEEERLRTDFARWHHNAYVTRGRYLEQVQSLEARFGPDQVRCVLFDDLTADPATTVASLRAWLGLPPAEGPALTDATARNTTQSVRSANLARLLWSRPGPARRAGAVFPPAIRAQLARSMERLTRHETPAIPRSPEVERQLAEQFAGPNAALAAHLGVDLSHWGAVHELE